MVNSDAFGHFHEVMGLHSSVNTKRASYRQMFD